MKNKLIAIISWLITAWMCKVFLSSIPYKISNHPDTQHIFGTIGSWLAGFLGQGVGNFFATAGPYLVGTFELITSLVVISPLLYWLMSLLGNTSNNGIRARMHRLGGLMAAMVMGGAVFFHLFTPLGIEVLHEGKSDGGSLFYAALSILVLGILMFIINRPSPKTIY